MNFKEYQKEAKKTDKNPVSDSLNKKTDKNPASDSLNKKNKIIPLLGLVGEAGALLSEYKKLLRDGENYTEFKKQTKEELGDLLWYISNVATKFGLDLDEIAKTNLEKTKNLFMPQDCTNKLYDKDEETKKQLPRTFCYEFSTIKKDGKQTTKILDRNNNQEVGDSLNDNSYNNDGYRYHDVMHLTFMAKFGWSPVWRNILRKKNIILDKRNNHDTEDSGRSQVIEEAIVLVTFLYARKHSFLKNITQIDLCFLKCIKDMTFEIEVQNRNSYAWNQVLKEGFCIWSKLKQHEGGIITGDLLEETISYKEAS